MPRIPLIVLAIASLALPANADEPPATRDFLFHYETVVSGLSPGQMAQVWLPFPPTNAEQRVSLTREHAPAPSQATRESTYGNRILYYHAPADAAGKISIALTYQVHRREVTAATGVATPPPHHTARLLQADTRVPIDGPPLDLLRGKALPQAPAPLARSLYDLVLDHMAYRKDGEGWGRGDAVWACQSGYGNCTDFHSLFIALARSRQLPSAFEIGFPLPPDRGSGPISGYHCWAKVRIEDGRWIPVDISEADKAPEQADYYFGSLTENRVTFSVGRDINLVPQQAAEPLNFFVYPHIEIDGQPHPPEHIHHTFRYEDLPAPGSPAPARPTPDTPAPGTPASQPQEPR